MKAVRTSANENNAAKGEFVETDYTTKKKI